MSFNLIAHKFLMGSHLYIMYLYIQRHTTKTFAYLLCFSDHFVKSFIYNSHCSLVCKIVLKISHGIYIMCNDGIFYCPLMLFPWYQNDAHMKKKKIKLNVDLLWIIFKMKRIQPKNSILYAKLKTNTVTGKVCADNLYYWPENARTYRKRVRIVWLSIYSSV